jgi:hypothetical protein
MKKTLMIFAAAILLVTVGITAAFAKSQTRGNPYDSERGKSSRKEVSKNDLRNAKENVKKTKPGQMGQYDLLGTVSSVNADKQIITVKDADGKETLVHVNPFTRVVEFSVRPVDTTPEKRPPEPPKQLKLSDVKTGDYVAVKKMETETKTIEAAKIIIAKEK